MTVLVTGVCGMIGGQVAELLCARGDTVVGYDSRSPSDDSRIAGVAYVRGDLNDHPRLYGALKEHNARKVVHAGAISAPFLEADNPYLVCQTNILGTINVYEACRLFGIERVVNFGSEAGYGVLPGSIVDEDTPLRPTSIYGVTKATGDMLGRVYAEQFGLDVVSFRPTLVYGPRRASYEPVRDMILGALRGQEVTLPASSALPFQGVYAKDVALAVLVALDAPRVPRRSYNITSGETFTLAEVAEAVRRHLLGARVRFEPDPGQPPPEPRPTYDISAITRDLAYQTTWPLERAIPDYIEWLRGHPV
jgi:nucleoside-diphosphate-sugar epimerase